MKSKALHSFQTRLSYFHDDIEIVDILRTAVLQGDLTAPNSKHILKYIDPTKHRHIARRTNSDTSRKNVINHLRTTLYSSFIKDLYEEITNYLKLILTLASRNGLTPGRVIGEHVFKMDAKSILELGNWENTCKAVTDSVFQSLEAERSTTNLLKKMRNKLGIDLDEGIIERAIPYLELRHFLVHSDGELSNCYIQDYPAIPTKIKNNGKFVDLNYNLITNARDSVETLVAAFDGEVVKKQLLAADDLMN